MSDVHFEPAGDGFHGRIAGAMSVEKVSALQSMAQEHFGDPPAQWAVIDLQDATPLEGLDRDEQERQVDNVNRVARNLMVIRRDEFRLAIVGSQRAVGEMLALLAGASTAVGEALPGRKLEIERFDDADAALTWARDGR